MKNQGQKRPPKEMLEKFASNLKDYSEKTGLSNQAIGEKIGVSDVAVGNYINGISLPRIDIGYEISKLTSLTMEELLTSKDQTLIKEPVEPTNHSLTTELIDILKNDRERLIADKERLQKVIDELKDENRSLKGVREGEERRSVR